jgi:hypothetical protein
MMMMKEAAVSVTGRGHEGEGYWHHGQGGWAVTRAGIVYGPGPIGWLPLPAVPSAVRESADPKETT